MRQKTISLVCVQIFLLISLSFVVSAETKTYDLGYDQNGNLQNGFDQYIEYNELNQVVRVRSGGSSGDIIEEYVYDVDGSRAIKYEPQLNQTTYYVSDNFIEVANSTGNYKFTYYYQDDVLVGRKDPDGRKYFYHPDHLGSTDLITDQSGNVVEETTYKPYGMVIDGGKTSDFLYTGKEKDSTNLYYYGARYYDPFFRHFTQPDVNIPDVYNPQDLNRYSYVRNNPYRYVDPEGETPWDVVDIAFIGYGLYRFIKDPSFRTAGELGVDVGFAVAPLLPNIKRIKEVAALAKAAGKAEDVGDVARAGEKVGDVGKVSETAKNVPNPYGRKGGLEHQAEVDKIVREIESNHGLKAKTEYTIRDPQTSKVKRFADVASTKKDKPIEFYQVGRTTKGGEPVARERRAIQDIQKTTGKRVTFRQYTPRRR